MINSELFLKKNSFSKCKILKIYLYKRSSELITEPKIIGVYTETGNLLILFNDFFNQNINASSTYLYTIVKKYESRKVINCDFKCFNK